MEFSVEFFTCDACKGRDFERVHNFGVRFYRVNFSEDLIYERLNEEVYRCTACGKTFTLTQIEDKLTEIKRLRKGG